MKTKPIPVVAVLVETSNGWGRAIIEGVGRYAGTHGPWHVWVEAWGRGAPIPLPKTWRGDGIIANVYSRAMASHLQATGVPVVNVSSVQLGNLEMPRVGSDLRNAGELAARHLLDRGFRHFAYCGLQRLSCVEHYRLGFVEALGKLGHECPVFKPGVGAGISIDWQAYHRDLTVWLRALPKPLGILAWPGHRGRQVIHACREAGLLVPEQVAVLVGDEDKVLCEACYPPLSAVALNSQRLGHEAAALLDRWILGGRPPKTPTLIPPIGVVERQSTHTLAIDDTDLACAIAMIRNHASDPIRVEDVLRAVPVSRRWLEQRFQEVLGRTPAAEIRRVHFEHAKRLLAETDMPIPDVAAGAGFGSPEYMAYVFKRETGLSPDKYRRKVRIR